MFLQTAALIASLGYVRTTEPRTAEAERQGFHLPPGFDISLVASEPAIGKPLNIAFDRQGRLWMTESREYPYAAPDDRPGKDRVLVLEDKDGDGRAETINTFADGLNIPVGILPMEDGAIVWSIPNIWRLRDRDGDGRADEREILYGPLGWKKDTHGMSASFRLGLDGWMYLTHGFNNSSTVVAKDGSRLALESGNTYRVRVDGSRVEPWATGQVNPFGLTFDPRGNLFSTDSHSDPIYLLLRGGSYPSFGRPHDGLGFAPRTVDHDHGSTALGGIAYYADDAWPDEFRDNVFGGNVGTNRVHRDRLVFDGSSPKAEHLPDFITSDDPWFRPVDLRFGPDGALYIADFYNRVISHYEVALDHPGRDRQRGRIWRVTYTGPGARPRALPDLKPMLTGDVLGLLESPSLVLRTAATHELVQRGLEAVVPLRSALRANRSGTLWTHGLWVLARLEKVDEATLKVACRHAAPVVRSTAARVISERLSWGPGERRLARQLLDDDNADVKRAAAEAIGRHPQLSDVPGILASLDKAPVSDPHLRQVMRIALRDELLPPGRLAAFTRTAAAKRYTRVIADVAPGIKDRAAAVFLLEYLANTHELNDSTRRYLVHAARQADDLLTPTVLKRVMALIPQDAEGQFMVASALAETAAGRGAALSGPAHEWAHGLARTVLTNEGPASTPVLIGRACELATMLKLVELTPALRSLLGRKTASLDTRGQAASALAVLEPGPALRVLTPLLRDGQFPLALRLRIADLAAGGAPVWNVDLIAALKAEPTRVQVRAARVMSRNLAGADVLLGAVKNRQLIPTLLVDGLVAAALERLNDKSISERFALLTRGVTAPDEHLDEIVEQRRKGFLAAHPNPAEGAAVFLANCAPCHRVGDKGNLVGPQLDGVGARGVERLIEDIMIPNRHIDEAFRAQQLQLTGGDELMGLVRREDANTLVLVDLTGRERVISKRDIAKRSVADVSVMPDNFSEALSEADTNRLLAFLLAPGSRSLVPARPR